MYETEQRSVSFEFTNTGGEELLIQEVKTSCGCTAARLDKRRYRPGESGSVAVVFDPTGPGRKSESITVISNAQAKSIERLTISAEVEPFLIFEPEWLQLGVLRYGREHRATVMVSSPDENFVIESVKATSPHAAARVLHEASGAESARPAKAIEVVILPAARWGGCYFALEVTARGRPFPGADPVIHTASIRVAGQLFGELRAEPDMFRFGAGPGETVERTVRLQGVGGRPFKVLGVSVADPSLPDAAVKATVVAPDAWNVTLSATAPAQAARCLGSVRVRTDVPGEDDIEIGILGVVRASPAG